jgi:hypothetical protein
VDSKKASFRASRRGSSAPIVTQAVTASITVGSHNLPVMTGSKLILAAQVLAGISVILTLGNDVNLGLPTRTVGIVAFVIAIASFAVGMRTPSLFVTGSLLLKGVIDTALAAQAVVAIGVAFGLVLLALGAIKGIPTWRAIKSTRAVLVADRSKRTAER